LQHLPYRTRWPKLRRRPAGADAVRHHLLLQHHAGRLSAQFAGGDVDNWHAYALNDKSRAPVAWDADALYAYLRHGWHPDHGTARGPMAEVVSNLSSVADNDVRAIAVYIADISGAPAPARKRPAEAVLAQAKSPATQADGAGAAIYAAACAACHETARPLPYGGVNLALSTAISSPDPRNLVNIVLSGVSAVEGERSPINARLCRQHGRRADGGAVRLSARPLRQAACVE
jgi:cytochrome c2